MDAVAFMKKYKNSSQRLSIDSLANTDQKILSATRYGSYKFSNAHSTFKGAFYQGTWRNGLPHELYVLL